METCLLLIPLPNKIYIHCIVFCFTDYDFGLRQTGERVHDIALPPWCNGDPRLFILIHRQALESAYVTQHLQHWIDLVFGFKQKGKTAIEAINVFHPAVSLLFWHEIIVLDTYSVKLNNNTSSPFFQKQLFINLESGLQIQSSCNSFSLNCKSSFQNIE